jgi:2-isopropylmalate synthase
MGKHSGRHALSTRLMDLGYELGEEALNDVFRRFKALADKKKGITDEDIIALVSDEVHQPSVVWELQDLQVVCGTMGLPTATVKMKGPDGISRVASGIGTGRNSHSIQYHVVGVILTATSRYHQLFWDSWWLKWSFDEPGPVDAAYKAIDSLVRVQVQLADYSVNSVEEGIEALATTRVVIRPSGKMANEAFVTSAQV